jgi:hypothetical protein
MATPALAPSPQLKEHRKTISPLLLAFCLAIAGAIFFGAWRNWGSLPMSVSLQNIGTLLAPIAFAAAVVERGVEILISPWRDAGANNLENEIAVIQARTPGNGVMGQEDQNALKAKSEQLEEYRGETQRLAFLVSMTLSTMVSVTGVRALGPFLATSAFAKAQPGQESFFYFVDVALTATLLAGGADGVHSIVNAVTTFFNTTADKTAKS